MQGAVGTSILGNPIFVEVITSTHLQKNIDSNIPALKQLIGRPKPEEILKASKAAIEDEKLARRVAMHLSYKHSGKRLKEIGELFGVRDTAISEASRRFQKELEADEKLIELTARVMKQANCV